MTDTDKQDPFGTDAPALGSEHMDQFEASIRRKISGNWSLASGVWDLSDDSTDSRLLVTFHHRDSISRIQLSTDPPWVDANVRVEVYRPLSKEQAREGPEDDVNDLTVTDKTFDMLPEAVWFAEHFARTVDERIPEDPATNLYGPVDGEPDV